MTVDPAILALAGAGAAQLIGVAFWFGVLTARVRTLEKQMEPMVALTSAVAVLGAQMSDVKHELEDLNKTLGWMRKS